MPGGQHFFSKFSTRTEESSTTMGQSTRETQSPEAAYREQELGDVANAASFASQFHTPIPAESAAWERRWLS